MKKLGSSVSRGTNRRAFLTNGMVAAGAATIGATLLPGTSMASGREEEDHAPITKGDIAILTFLSALEQVEADLWIQYAELGGPTSKLPDTLGLSPIDLELNGKKIVTGLAPAYITGLIQLDGDMPQYIADNTDDEISQHRWIPLRVCRARWHQSLSSPRSQGHQPGSSSRAPQHRSVRSHALSDLARQSWQRYPIDRRRPHFPRPQRRRRSQQRRHHRER